MHRGDQAEFPRQREVSERHFQGRVVRAEDRHAERDLALIRRQALHQAPHLGARMRDLPERRLPRLGVGLGAAMEKRRANPRFDQPVDARVGVFRRRVVVAPVDQGRGSAVDLVQRAHQCADADVGRGEMRGQPGVHVLEVFEQGPVRGHAAQRRLPGVHVGVDESGRDDEAGGVDHFRVRRLDAGGDPRNARALDQQVGADHAGRVARRGRHGHQRGVADEDASHRIQPSSPSLISTFSDFSSSPALFAVSISSTAKSTSS